MSQQFGPLAQRLEQRTHNPLVLGSNPRWPTEQKKDHFALQNGLFFGEHQNYFSMLPSIVSIPPSSLNFISRNFTLRFWFTPPERSQSW